MNKEQIIAAALRLDEYERKQIAMILIASTMTELAKDEALELLPDYD